MVIEGRHPALDDQRLELVAVDVYDTARFIRKFGEILRPHFEEKGVTAFYVTTIGPDGHREETTL